MVLYMRVHYFQKTMPATSLSEFILFGGLGLTVINLRGLASNIK